MDYKEAIRRVKAWQLDADDMEVLSVLIPELKENEDERIRKSLKDFLRDIANGTNRSMPSAEQCQTWLVFLERQKETLKSTNSIPADCVQDAKLEDCWHKVADSFPDSTREVICKDAIGNFFIGRYYKGSNSWEVSMYDDADKSNEDNPPVVMWCDIPSEKQKDQKPVYEDEYQKMLADSYKSGKNEVIDNPEKYGLYKSAERSEEEIDKVVVYLHERDGGMLWSKAKEIASDICDILCPQSHWKPSEEQMKALWNSLHRDNPYYFDLLSLYNDLRKL